MNSAVKRKDAGFIVNHIPETLYREDGNPDAQEKTELRKELQEALQKKLDQWNENGFTLDTSAIRHAETENGTFYALVPTRTETNKK